MVECHQREGGRRCSGLAAPPGQEAALLIKLRAFPYNCMIWDLWLEWMQVLVPVLMLTWHAQSLIHEASAAQQI